MSVRIVDPMANSLATKYTAKDHFHGRLPVNTSHSKSRVEEFPSVVSSRQHRTGGCRSSKIEANRKTPLNKWMTLIRWSGESEIVIVNEIKGRYRGLRLTVNIDLRGHGSR
jgi:hypothetical protein